MRQIYAYGHNNYMSYTRVAFFLVLSLTSVSSVDVYAQISSGDPCAELQTKVDDLQARVTRMQRERTDARKEEEKREAAMSLARAKGGSVAAQANQAYASPDQITKMLPPGVTLPDSVVESLKHDSGNSKPPSTSEISSVESDLAKAQNDLAYCKWQKGSGTSKGSAEVPQAAPTQPPPKPTQPSDTIVGNGLSTF